MVEQRDESERLLVSAGVIEHAVAVHRDEVARRHRLRGLEDLAAGAVDEDEGLSEVQPSAEKVLPGDDTSHPAEERQRVATLEHRVLDEAEVELPRLVYACSRLHRIVDSESVDGEALDPSLGEHLKRDVVACRLVLDGVAVGEEVRGDLSRDRETPDLTVERMDLLGHLPGEEVDIAPVEYLLDLRERETDRFELLDRVECGALIEAVVPVARLSVDAYGDEQALLVVDAERLLRDTVQFSHLPYQQLAHGYLYW